MLSKDVFEPVCDMLLWTMYGGVLSHRKHRIDYIKHNSFDVLVMCLDGPQPRPAHDVELGCNGTGMDTRLIDNAANYSI